MEKNSTNPKYKHNKRASVSRKPKESNPEPVVNRKRVTGPLRRVPNKQVISPCVISIPQSTPISKRRAIEGDSLEPEVMIKSLMKIENATSLNQPRFKRAKVPLSFKQAMIKELEKSQPQGVSKKSLDCFEDGSSKKVCYNRAECENSKIEMKEFVNEFVEAYQSMIDQDSQFCSGTDAKEKINSFTLICDKSIEAANKLNLDLIVVEELKTWIGSEDNIAENKYIKNASDCNSSFSAGDIESRKFVSNDTEQNAQKNIVEWIEIPNDVIDEYLDDDTLKTDIEQPQNQFLYHNEAALKSINVESQGILLNDEIIQTDIQIENRLDEDIIEAIEACVQSPESEIIEHPERLSAHRGIVNFWPQPARENSDFRESIESDKNIHYVNRHQLENATISENSNFFDGLNNNHTVNQSSKKLKKEKKRIARNPKLKDQLSKRKSDCQKKNRHIYASAPCVDKLKTDEISVHSELFDEEIVECIRYLETIVNESKKKLGKHFKKIEGALDAVKRLKSLKKKLGMGDLEQAEKDAVEKLVSFME